ncbi:DUF6624 domain-containing protein [Pedobacter sp. GR22-10]|uniref:DUF6624 domain-containing protein n=1 Tax=Pedobacter sp. GR22-10 TaxID=2994472 RepID=UPI002245D363|nr:DUF6624 domain-containing protein [Pedobacter sp. GR22-10]MCX2429173.1 hypothetical protein [Pedobacter sp. GR22-10]
MMKTILAILFLSAPFSGLFAQKQFNLELKKQLDTILQLDQGIREFGDTETTEIRKDTLAAMFKYPKKTLTENLWKVMNEIDSVNLIKIEAIISKYGYPGKSMVGEPTNTAAFFVIQHSPNLIPKYYPLIEKAGKAGELPFKYTAMMLDRKLSNEGKEQLYGTQIYGVKILNKITGKKDFFRYVVPIKDTKNVNKRRKKAGFDTTVEENTKRFGFSYKAYTLEEIKKITKQTP